MTNILQATPVVRVSDYDAAIQFYCEKLGFTREWEYRLHPEFPNPVYAGLSRDGATLHITSFTGDGALGHVALFYVRDVDALYAEFTARDVAIELEPTDQTWGTRDMYVLDADGNSLRFCQSAEATANAG